MATSTSVKDPLDRKEIRRGNLNLCIFIGLIFILEF